MAENETPVTPVQDTPVAPVMPVGGQSDWEARFKGLQTSYNALKATADSKDAALGTVKSQFDEFKTAQQKALEAAQIQLADLGNQKKAAETERDTHLTRAQQLEADLGKFKSRAEQRQKLVAAQGTDLIEAFEANFLNLDGVADEAIPAALTSFRTLAAKIAGQQYSGTAPVPPVVLPTTNATGMTLEQLDTWLETPANLSNPQWEAMNDARYSLVSK